MPATRLDDGFSSTIGFGLNASVHVYEKSIKPPGIHAGGAVDTTTMRNVAYRTASPKRLKTLAEGTVKVAYATSCLSQLLAMVGKNQLITVTFSDGSTWAFYGWIDEFNPDALVEGQQPEAEIKFIPSNQDASGAEQAPTYGTPGPTTTTTTGT